MGRIDLAQDKDECTTPVNTVMNFLVSWNIGKLLSGCTTGGFSRKAQLGGVSELELMMMTHQWRSCYHC
jgi:hypothetical protein